MVRTLRELMSLCFLSVKTIPDRTAITLTAAIGFAVTAGVLVAVLALSAGVSDLWASSARNDIAIVMAKGSFTELNSRLPEDAMVQLSQAPGVLDNSGELAITPQLAITQTLPRASGGAGMAIVLRGLSRPIPEHSSHLKLTSGRWFSSGKNEVVVGSDLVSPLANANVGDSIKIGSTPFYITGTFTDGRSIHSSEIWGDLAQIGIASAAPNQVSSIYVHLKSPRAFDKFSNYLSRQPNFSGYVVRESTYLDRQSGFYRRITLIPGLVIVAILGLAALLAAINTAQSSVLSRSRDLATLRAIGFGRGISLLHIIFESLFIGLLGSIFGALLAAYLFNNTSFVTSAGLTSMVIKLAVTPTEVIGSVLSICLVSGVAGLGPSLTLYRMRVAHALRGI